jgi:ATP-dependent Clp protease adaptor protein ClpS
VIKLNLPEDSDIDRSSGTAVLEQEPQVKEPPMYQVLLLNDDYTPMEFVVYVLQHIFNHEHEKATQIMMAVHSEVREFVVYFQKRLLK